MADDKKTAHDDKPKTDAPADKKAAKKPLSAAEQEAARNLKAAQAQSRAQAQQARPVTPIINKTTAKG